jgi:hypothetical protein
MSRVVDSVMYVQDERGRITCKHCGHNWHPRRLSKHRWCQKCRKVIYPAPIYSDQCHPKCKGLCFIKVHDWMIARQIWVATPGSNGIVWKIVKGDPTTLHDLMLFTGKQKRNVNRFLQTGMEKGRLARRRRMEKPRDEVHKLKTTSYFYNRDKKWRKPAYRSRRPTWYQYFPTHWAMVDFLARNPEMVEREKGEVPFWKPMSIRKERTLLKFSPILLPVTPEETAFTNQKREKTLARIDRQVGHSPNKRR